MMIASRRDVSRLVQHGAAVAYFQPVEDLQTGICHGFEVLARLPFGDGLLPPDAFLPHLGPDDRLNLFGTMIGQAIALLRRQKAQGRDIYVSINVEISLLVSDDFVDILQYMLERYDFAKERLVLEILENEEIHDLERLAARLEAIRALGLSLALDDIGSGYASLGKVKRLPVDICKLDRVFLRDLAEKPEDLVFVMSVQLLARGLGRTLVVEGIETPEIYDAMRILGVRYGQGYAIAQPMPAAGVDAWLAARTARAPDRVPTCLLGTYASVLCVGETYRALRLQPLPLSWAPDATDHLNCVVGMLFTRRKWHDTPFGRAHAQFHRVLARGADGPEAFEAAFLRFREAMAAALRAAPAAYRCEPLDQPVAAPASSRRRRRAIA